MGAGPAGLPRCELAVDDHRFVVAGLRGVMQHPKRVRTALGQQRPQHVGVQPEPHAGRYRGRDGPAGELVTERQHVPAQGQHLRPFGLGDRGRIGLHDPKQIQLDAGWHDGQPFEDRPSRGAQLGDTRQHGVDHGGRHVRVRAGQYFGDIERIPGRQPEELRGVHVSGAGKSAHGQSGQRSQPQPERVRPGESAQHGPERMDGVDLVIAIGHHEQGWEVRHPAPEEAQHV